MPRPFNGERTILSTCRVRKLDIHYFKKNEVSFFIPHTNTNSKWIKTKFKSLNSLKKMSKSHVFGFGNGFLNITPKAQPKIKEEMN